MSLIKLITPTNLKAEKGKFFANASYNPQFEYDWNKKDIDTWVEKNQKYELLVTAILEQDCDEITRQAQQVFDTLIDQKYLSYAQEIIKNKPARLIVPSHSQVEISFKKSFEQLGLIEYSLKIVDQMGFNFRPSPSNKKIIMSKHTQFDFYSLDAYIKHELAHVVRFENGKANEIVRDEHYLPTEEGLASFCQDFAGENGEVALFQRASEYVVTKVGLTGSLVDMVEFLISIGFTPELAWQRATRHKFGFKDTKMSGDIMKPAMYFHHQQKVKELSEEEKYRLFVGKISIDSLDKFPAYEGRIPLEVLKKFYQWRS